MVSMSTIYILDEPNITELKQIQDVLNPHYKLLPLSGLDALNEELKGQSYAVVLMPFSPGKPLVAQVKSTLPTATCIEICAEQEAEKISGHSFETDFLISPMTSLDILSRVSTALRQSELLANVEASAQQDEITQLYNRRYFLQRLNEEISLSKRHMSPLACVIIGVDFFQLHLDSYGYDFVNNIVCKMADVIQTHKRNEDIIARIGDDEIGLLLPRSTEKGAKILANRIVQSIQGVEFHSGKDIETLSIHSGIAGFPLSDPDEVADADALVRYARHALHNARCTKKERVTIFSQIKPQI